MSIREVLQPLTPVSNADDGGQYSECLEYAIEHEKVTNIAITGPYGSGKSSIIDTFIESKKNELNSIKVSLAEFGAEEKTEDNFKAEQVQGNDEDSQEEHNQVTSTNHVKSLSLIERSILQQLFYQIPIEKISYSRFKTIKHFTAENLNGLALVFFLSLLLVISFFNLPTLYELSTFIANSTKAIEGKGWVVYSILVFIASCSLYIVIRILITIVSKFKFSSFNLNSIGEVKLENKDDSLLNIYLDEIIYFFRQQKIDVVFFEDLDRFDGVDIEIFTKLRELNHLLNSADSISYTVNFVFALKDDMFHCNEERTKFFDFVIPVIPYINKSNAANVLKTSLLKNKHYPEVKKISENLIEQVAYFVGDMRTLINIQNEFWLYHQKLAERLGDVIEPEKLLGFMVYKNVYPNDFADLNKGEGKIVCCLKQKNEMIKEQIQILKEDIRSLQIKIQSAKQENLDNLTELNLLTNSKIFSLATQIATYVHVNDSSYPVNKFLSNSDDTQMFLSNSLWLNQNNNNRLYGGEQIKIPSELVDWYEKRKKTVFEKNNPENLQNQIKLKEKEIDVLKRKSFGQLLSSYPSLSEKLALKFPEDELLLFLLKNESIDDNYDLYLTFHHEGGLTLSDLEFIHNVRTELGVDYLKHLNSPKKVAEKLRPRYIVTESALNIDLVNYLLQTTKLEQDNSDLANLFLSYKASEKKDLLYEFCFAFFEVSPEVPKFILFMSNWPEFWSFVRDYKFDENIQNKIFKLLVKQVELNTLNKLDESDEITGFLYEKEDITEFFGFVGSNTKLIKVIDALEIKFTKDNFKTISNKGIYSKLIFGDAYELNLEMVNLILQEECLDSLNESYLEKLLSTIWFSECEALQRRVKYDVNTFIENIYPILNEQIESDDFVNDVLSLDEEKLSLENKACFLLKQSGIENLKEVSEEWHEFLFENNLVKPVWENVLVQFAKTETIDGFLLNFLNDESNSNILSQQKLSPELADESLVKKLSILILKNNQVKDKNYEQFLSAINWRYRNLTISELSSSKINALLDKSIIIFSEKNLEAISQSFPLIKKKFIKKYFKEFVNNYTEGDLTDEELQSYLKLSYFDDEQKIKLIKLKADFLRSNLDDFKDDLYYALLANNYQEQIDIDLISDLLESDAEEEDKVKLLVTQLPCLDDKETIGRLVSLLGNKYLKVIENNAGRQQFDYTSDNVVLFQFLKDKLIVGNVNANEEKNKLIVFSKKNNFL